MKTTTLNKNKVKLLIDKEGFPLFWDVPIKMSDLTDITMLFSASWDFACDNDAMTHCLLDLLKKNASFQEIVENAPKDYHLVVDSRVTHCMKGMYPSIPGWHCDEVPRDKETGQPDFEAFDENVHHWMILVSTDPMHSRTKFLTHEFEFSYTEDSTVYQQLDKQVSEAGKGFSYVENKEWYHFKQDTVHTASEATSNAWRYFLRVSLVKDRPIQNVIRKQVQVYLTDPSQGW
ncbi:MAG: hypothetical protein AAGM67_00665 [Bacteroidota bacterium]